MLGGGTKLDTIPNKLMPIFLDCIRLLSRTGMLHTGVDRVEWAYLEWCLSLDRPVYGLVRSAFGYLLLDRRGLTFAHTHLKEGDWGVSAGLSQLAFKLSSTRRGAETALRKHAIGRTLPAGLPRLLKRQFSDGLLYLNTGHSNLTKRVFASFAKVKNAQKIVLIHDLIPLDWPDYQRAGTVEQFEKSMRVVSRYADGLICNSQKTLDECERHMGGLAVCPLRWWHILAWICLNCLMSTCLMYRFPTLSLLAQLNRLRTTLSCLIYGRIGRRRRIS